MINLLPQQQKEEIKKEKNLRLVLILGVLILVSLVCLYLILLTITIFVSTGAEVQKILYQERETELKTPHVQDLQKNLNTINKTLTQLDSFYQDQVNSTEVLERISSTLPAGVFLTNLSLNFQSEKGICNLAGFSPTRDLLLELKANLETEKDFDEVYFPPTNWVQPNDINFTLNFKVMK